MKRTERVVIEDVRSAEYHLARYGPSGIVWPLCHVGPLTTQWIVRGEEAARITATMCAKCAASPDRDEHCATIER